MIRTRVGYAGGTKAHPTYYNMGDHSETVQVDFDPTVVTFAQLLEVFREAHMPHTAFTSRQYANIAFFENKEQEVQIREVFAHWEEEKGMPVRTEVKRIDAFHIAEDYHQKFYLQNSGSIWAEVRAWYPEHMSWVNSTMVARANAYIAGMGDPALLEREIDSYGLSVRSQNQLLSHAGLPQK